MSQVRVVIENITPQVDCGRYPVKRVVGEAVVVEADVFADGHDMVRCVLLYRSETRSGVEPHADGAARQRPLDCALRAARDGSLPVHRHGVGGSPRYLAARSREEAGSRAGRARRSAARQAAREGRPRRGHRRPARAAARCGSGSRARALLNVVRVVSALGGGEARRARHVRGCRSAPAVHRVDGLRRAVSAADSSHRPRRAQGAEQQAGRLEERSGQPLGHRRRGGRTQGDSSRARHARRISSGWSRRRASTASRSRSTSPSSAARIIRTCASIPSGSCKRPDGTIQYAENPPKKYQDIYPFHFETEAWQRAVGGAQERVRVLDRAGRAHLPRGQSAHQALPDVAVDHRAR